MTKVTRSEPSPLRAGGGRPLIVNHPAPRKTDNEGENMTKIGNFDLKTSEGVQDWIIDHEAKIKVYWEHQWEWNKKADKRVEENVRRINRLETKIAVWASLAGAAAGLIATFLPKLLGATGGP